jgi:hypothetical protein
MATLRMARRSTTSGWAIAVAPPTHVMPHAALGVGVQLVGRYFGLRCVVAFLHHSDPAFAGGTRALRLASELGLCGRAGEAERPAIGVGQRIRPEMRLTEPATITTPNR